MSSGIAVRHCVTSGCAGSAAGIAARARDPLGRCSQSLRHLTQALSLLLLVLVLAPPDTRPFATCCGNRGRIPAASGNRAARHPSQARNVAGCPRNEGDGCLGPRVTRHSGIHVARPARAARARRCLPGGRCARALGVTPTRLRSATLEAPFRGIRRAPFIADDVDEDAPFARDRLARERTLHTARAYAPLLPPSGFFAGRTAAVLWGCTRHPRTGSRSRCSRGRALRAGWVSGPAPSCPRLRPCGCTRAFASRAPPRRGQCSAPSPTRRRRRGRRGGAHPRDRWGILRADAALATVAELQAAVDAGRRAGAARLRAALASIVTGAASPPETLHRLDCAAGPAHAPPRRRGPRRRGAPAGRGEFAYPSARLAVELEGDHHRTSARQHRDIEGRAYAEAGLGGRPHHRRRPPHRARCRGRPPRLAAAAAHPTATTCQTPRAHRRRPDPGPTGNSKSPEKARRGGL
jgi:hypothetical protein